MLWFFLFFLHFLILSDKKNPVKDIISVAEDDNVSRLTNDTSTSEATSTRSSRKEKDYREEIYDELVEEEIESIVNESDEEPEEKEKDDGDTEIIEIPAKYASTRWGKTSKNTPTDQFFTPKIALTPIVPFVQGFKVAFEPACGEGHITEFLEELGLTVISRDKYTTTEMRTETIDYLDPAVEIPDYDVLITNPPFCLKYEFLKKAYESGNININVCYKFL